MVWYIHVPSVITSAAKTFGAHLRTHTIHIPATLQRKAMTETDNRRASESRNRAVLRSAVAGFDPRYLLQVVFALRIADPSICSLLLLSSVSLVSSSPVIFPCPRLRPRPWNRLV
jgi:hypothetical protein